jgi:hypothetical protein
VQLLPARVEAAPGAPVDLAPAAQQLDVVLRDALLDFGLQPLEATAQAARRDELALVELARERWVVAPELALEGGALRLRLVAVAPGSSVLWVRVQAFEPAQLEVRSVRLLRELIEPQPAAPREPLTPAAEAPVPTPGVPRLRSSGRAVLALHTAALGGYLGYSLQRASGSNDARLTYPLAALGAGVGLGSAVIVAEEWDINLARAWFLGASMFWPTVGISLATERKGADRNLLGVVGAVGGLTLGTAALALGHVDDGGAAFTHSGALLGLVLGGLGEMIVEGDAQLQPTRGIRAGVTVAGAFAPQFPTPDPTELLSIDLSALLGGLGGAALGTPLLVSQERSVERDRFWLSGVMLGTLVGVGVGYWITRGDASIADPPAAASVAPRLRLELGAPASPLGLSVSGRW